MDNSMFVDDENMPLVNHHHKDCGNDYDDCNTPNISNADDTTFTTSGFTDKNTA